MTTTCDDCGKTWPESKLREVKHITQRVDIGGPMPAGECPECGALCYEEDAPYDPDTGRTNENRADDAYRTMLVWRQRTGRAECWEEDIRDLIADLLHLSVQYGLDPEHECQMALTHFAAEVNGYPEGCEPDEKPTRKARKPHGCLWCDHTEPAVKGGLAKMRAHQASCEYAPNIIKP